MSGDTLFVPSAEGAPFAFTAEEAAALADAVLERFRAMTNQRIRVVEKAEGAK